MTTTLIGFHQFICNSPEYPEKFRNVYISLALNTLKFKSIEPISLDILSIDKIKSINNFQINFIFTFNINPKFHFSDSLILDLQNNIERDIYNNSLFSASFQESCEKESCLSQIAIDSIYFYDLTFFSEAFTDETKYFQSSKSHSNKSNHELSSESIAIIVLTILLFLSIIINILVIRRTYNQYTNQYKKQNQNEEQQEQQKQEKNDQIEKKDPLPTNNNTHITGLTLNINNNTSSI